MLNNQMVHVFLFVQALERYRKRPRESGEINDLLQSPGLFSPGGESFGRMGEKNRGCNWEINFVDKQGINNHVIYLIEFAEMGTFRCVYFLFPWEIHHFGLGNRHGPKLIPRVADRLEQ